MEQFTVDSQFFKDIIAFSSQEININFPNDLSGIEEVKEHLYRYLFP